jgi:hypothetical protein
VDDALAKHENNIKSLENYLEKYVPCNTQNLIIENLKQFVSKDIIARLKSQSNMVQAHLTTTLLSDTGNGNIIHNVALQAQLKMADELARRQAEAAANQPVVEVPPSRKGRKRGGEQYGEWDGDDAESVSSFEQNTQLELMKLA